MKHLMILFALTGGTALIAETKAEAELKKQLEATQAALTAERARNAALSAGTKKLSDAVAVQAETSKSNAEKIEVVADKITKTEENDKRLVETVKAQGVATQSATRTLADVVTTQNAAVTTAISAQTKQQQIALAAAREVARQLEEQNKELARRYDESRIAKEQNDKQLKAVSDDLKELKTAQLISAAEDKRGAQKDQYKFWTDLGTPLIQGACTILLALVVYFQLKASGQAKQQKESIGQIATTVNGRTDRLLEEVDRLKTELSRLQAGQG